MAAIDMTGVRVGRLLVRRRSGSDRNGKAQWLCKCDCGSSKVVNGRLLRKRSVRSCGCFRKEYLRTSMRKRATTHGKSRSRTYQSWVRMISRCTNTKDPSWPRYGGRGISVHQPWRDSFGRFLSDMGERPIGTSLDRIDNDSGYRPDNCRWATNKQQCRNTSRNHILTLNGKSKTLTEWAEEIGITRNTLYWRVSNGWNVERALTTAPAALGAGG